MLGLFDGAKAKMMEGMLSEDINHNIFLGLNNHSYTKHMTGAALGFGAVGGIMGASSDDGTLMGGLAEGVALGAAKGAATKWATSRYAAGAVREGAATELNGMFHSTAGSKYATSYFGNGAKAATAVTP